MTFWFDEIKVINSSYYIVIHSLRFEITCHDFGHAEISFDKKHLKAKPN